MSEDMIDRVIYDETVDALRISILHARELADRIAALEAEASEGERRGLERAADLVAARVPMHSTRQRQAYEAGRDRLGEARHAQHCEALAIETMLRALIPEAPAREGWRPIETAPRDGTVVWVWCPAYEDLDALTSLASWHEDAGWCVDELRTPTHWHLLPPSPPQDHREGE